MKKILKQRRRIFSVLMSLALMTGLFTSVPVAQSAPPKPPGAGFDDDGFGDLAIGVPYEEVDGTAGAGAVNVIYGSSPDGLIANNDDLWIQGDSDLEGTPEEDDRFGENLAAGDFNDDGLMDLAIGVPWQDVGGDTNAGAVHVIYGATNGLSPLDDEVWTQDSPGVMGLTQAYDWFGDALATGDFDGDGYDDLAIGVPGEDVSSEDRSGGVNVIYGSENGLVAVITAGVTNDQFWSQDDPAAIGGVALEDDQFGYSLAAGDFDDDGYDDLAIGVIGEHIIGDFAGAVNIIYGSDVGLAPADNWYITQEVPGIVGVSQENDNFGWALAVGNFNGDQFDDLAIGVRGEDINGDNAAGAVNVVFGSSNGLSEAGNQMWHQDRNNTQNAAEPGDHFGESLAAGDFNNDGYADLAVGIPDENQGSTDDTGAVHLFYGADGGLTTQADWFFFQGALNSLDPPEEDDHFGHALAAGDFDGDGYADLAIGVPGEDFGDPLINRAGVVNVVYGALSGIRSQIWDQDLNNINGVAEVDDRFGWSLVATGIKKDKTGPALSITKTVSPSSDVPREGEVTYTILLYNTGDTNALSVAISDTLPAQVDFGGWVEQPAGAAVTDDELSWTGTAPIDGPVTFEFTATYSATWDTEVTNTVTFTHTTGTGDDPATFTVQSQPMIFLPLIMPDPQPTP